MSGAAAGYRSANRLFERALRGHLFSQRNIVAYLSVFDDSGEVREIHLPGKRLIVGRDPDYADFVIDDPAVSRMHLMILQTDGGYQVKDMESTGGTLLNKKKIKQSILQDGDSIQLGGTVMEFHRNDADSTDLPDDACSNTISGIASRFRPLPAGMGLNCRLLHTPPFKIFSPGDTILIGSGGIRFTNFLGDEPEDVVLELELVWPDGRKKNFLGEILQYYRGQMCVKLHAISRADYERLLGNVKRGSWIPASRP